MFNDQHIQQTCSHETFCAFEEIILNYAVLHGDVFMGLRDGHSLSLEDHFIHILNKPEINDNNVQLILIQLVYIHSFFSIKKKMADWKLWSSPLTLTNRALLFAKIAVWAKCQNICG